ncbi:T9SS type A sorting domain-containing protein [Taibaiella soli]|uniref:Secretion system C-terminal sorting domain-containing protein n=1 Tax=Taibaiella soli TaxID=1649169 RepID=A0A2W2AVU5_9BACT|nr:T9SS type A sorting domain-containing protein [Taibaiella soli]PZF72094.1 hypothetical protein DN068_14240 [Taibaiella soli]
MNNKEKYIKKMNRKSQIFNGLTAAFVTTALFSVPVITNAQVQSITKANTLWVQGTGSTITSNGAMGGSNFVTQYGTNTGRTDNDLALQNFTTSSGKKYGMSSTLPTTVTFRRVDNANVQGIRHQMFFQNLDSMYDGNTGNRHTPFQMRPSYSNDMTDAFSGKFLNRGSDNIFGNVNETYGNFNDIERIDIVFQTPQQVYANEGNGAVIFERGLPNQHGQVKLAAILSVDAGGNPTSYSTVVLADNSTWAANDITDTYNWAVYRRDAAVQTDMGLSNDWVGMQSIGGIFIPYTSFGLSAGSTIYGYSIIPADFTGSTSADILNYTNNALYPLTTDAANNLSAGGIDIIGVTGSFVETKSLPQTLSGNVFHDANGLSDNTVNGTGIGVINATQLYINVVDPEVDTVVATVPVNADGTWQITGVPSNTTYSVEVSKTQGTVGDNSSMSSLTGAWVSTGENVGLGAGNDGNANGMVNVQVDLAPVANIDFGIEQYPTATNQTYNIGLPVNNSTLVLNGTGTLTNPGPLKGTDPEDGALGASNTIIITSIPTGGAKLLYDGTPVTVFQQITNYDPTKLAIQFTGSGYSLVKFGYETLDAAGQMGMPGTYTINFPQPLDLKLISFSGQTANDADVLSWTTTDEKNMDKFEVELSTDAAQYKVVGSVSAKNIAGTNYYQFTTPTSNTSRYYRLKMDETDGKVTYSNVVVLKSDSKTNKMKAGVTPNPVGVQATAHLTIQRSEAGKISVNIFNQTGQTMQTSEVSAAQGSTTVDINTSGWVSGIYFIAVTDKSTGEHTTIKVVK